MKVIDAAAKRIAAQIRDLKSTVDSYMYLRDGHGWDRHIHVCRIGSGQDFCKLQ